MTFACGIGSNGAAPQVQAQFATFNGYALQLIDQSVAVANNMLQLQVPSVTFDVSIDQVQSYNIKDTGHAPVLVDVSLAELPDFPSDPGFVPPTGPTQPFTLPRAPTNAPDPSIPAAPSLYTPTFGVTPAPIFPTVPTYSDLTAGVPFPTLRTITLPTPPTLAIDAIVFGGARPVFTAQEPDANDFAYTDDGYDPLLVDTLKSKITLMLGGATGLPADVENAIWARQAERQDEQDQRAVQEALDEFATLGHVLPSGALASKIAQVRQNSQNQRNSLGRDVMVRVHEVLLDQLKFGVAQGIALEDLWMRLYTSVQDRKLQAARIAVDIAIAVFNAKVGLFQAEAEVFKIEAEVYKTRIEAELAKLQVYSEELRAQQLIGELNLQDIQVYTARLSAIETNVRVYLANIQAYAEQVKTQGLILDAFRTTIEIEKEKVAAKSLEVQEWQGQIQGQALIQEAWKNRTQVYVAMLQGWSQAYLADIERFKGELAQIDTVTNRFKILSDSYVSHGQYEKSRADVILASNEQKVQGFTAQVTADTGYNTALVQKMKSTADAIRDRKELALKNAEVNAQNVIEAIRVLGQIKEVAARVLSQLAAGVTSAISVHAGISDATSESISCNYNTSQTVD